MVVRGMTEGWFTGKKVSSYLPSKGLATLPQPTSARLIINGLDHAKKVAKSAMSSLAALIAGRWACFHKRRTDHEEITGRCAMRGVDDARHRRDNADPVDWDGRKHRGRGRPRIGCIGPDRSGCQDSDPMPANGKARWGPPSDVGGKTPSTCSALRSYGSRTIGRAKAGGGGYGDDRDERWHLALRHCPAPSGSNSAMIRLQRQHPHGQKNDRTRYRMENNTGAGEARWRTSSAIAHTL
jgi:hypothetical protein